jgi:hypothetical protein
VLLLDVYTRQGLSCTWTCLHKRSLCCFVDVSTLKKPELHLDIVRLQEPVLLLDLSTLKRHVLLNVSAKHRPDLHLKVSGQQEPVLLVWTFLYIEHLRGLSFT